MFINTRKQGDAGLGQAIAYFTMKGYAVCLPLTDNQDYDLVVEIDGVLKKVQVKTGSTLSPAGNGIFFMAVQGGNKSAVKTTKLVSAQVWDYMFGYHLLTKQIIFIPKDKVIGDTQLTLCKEYAEWIVQ